MGVIVKPGKIPEKTALRIETLSRDETALALAHGPHETDRAHFELTIRDGEIEGGEAVETGEDGSGLLADCVGSSGIGFVIEEGVPVPRIDRFNRLLVTYHNGFGGLRARPFDNRSCIPMDAEREGGLPAHRLECFETSFLGAAEFVSLKVGDFNGDGQIDMAYLVDDPILGRQTYLFQRKPISEIAPEGHVYLGKVYAGLLADGVELDARFIGRMRALGAKIDDLMRENLDLAIWRTMEKIDYAMNLGRAEERLDYLEALLDVFERSGEDLRIPANLVMNGREETHLDSALQLMRLAGLYAQVREKGCAGSEREAYLVNMMSALYWHMRPDEMRWGDAEYAPLVRSVASMGKGMTEEQLAGVHAALWFGFLRQEKAGNASTPLGLALRIDRAMSAPDAKGRYAALYDLFKGDLDLDADFLVKYSQFITSSNLPTIEDLKIADAAIGPDDALLLYQSFNITRFARYHPTVLRHLVDMAKDPDHMRERPLVMIVTAQYDGNGMFHWGRRFKHDPRVRVVAVEVGSVLEFDSVVRLLLKRYGAPDSMMITAHGDPLSMMMGYVSTDQVRSSKTGFLMAENGSAGHTVSSLSVDRHYDFLSKSLGRAFRGARPQIVLNSCSTGKERPDGRINVAQMFANIFQTDVYAPEAVEGLLKLGVELDANGRARLVPLFAEVRGGPIGLNHGGRRFTPQPEGVVTPRGSNRFYEESISSSGKVLQGSEGIPDLGRKETRRRAREFFREIFTGRGE